MKWNYLERTDGPPNRVWFGRHGAFISLIHRQIRGSIVEYSWTVGTSAVDPDAATGVAPTEHEAKAAAEAAARARAGE